MLRLTVLSGARLGQRFDFARVPIRIGRAPDNDLAFDASVDLDASAHHAEIRGENGQWVLYDAQSRNGTFVAAAGGQRISRHVLAHGDQVQFGPKGPRIGVELFGPAPWAAPPPANAAYTAPAAPLPIPTAAVPAIAPVAAQPPAPMPGMPNVAPASPPQVMPPQAPPAAGAEGPRRMGQQTLLAHVGAMIAQQNKGKSTKEIQALVDSNVKRETGRLRVVIGVLGVVVVLALGAVGYLAVRQSDDATALRKELDALPMSDPKRAAIEKKLADKTGNKEESGRAIYENNKGALFMLVAHRGKTYEKGGFCTAFAIKPNVLASNAHCVKAAREFEDDGREIWAHLNESNDGSRDPKMIRVGRYAGHPKYEHSGNHITPDVGLFELEGGTAKVVTTRADRAELQKLGTGDALYVIGFPGRAMDEASPVATFMFSHVGRVTDAQGQRAESFGDGWLIQHEGQTTPGTSGSPIFDAEGHVVAINAGGLLESNKQSVYKYAMRIDLLDKVPLDEAKKSAPKKKSSSDDDDD
jgi:V8-like Glu-specific endopeptidase